MRHNIFFSIAIGFLSFFAIAPAGAQWVYTGVAANCFAVSGTNLFAGNNGLASGTIPYGVYLSTDNGTSWTAVDSGLTNLYVYALAVSGTNLIAGTGGGVFLSTNNGTNWTAVDSGIPPGTSIAALEVSGSNLFAGTDIGVFLSTDNGATWAAANNGLTTTNIYALAVIGTNLIASASVFSTDGVFLSTDNAASWTDVDSANLFTVFAVSGANLFAGAYGGGVYLSTNNGTSWTAVNSNVYALALEASGTNLFAGTADSGVYLSTNNGTSWNAVGLAGSVSALFVIGTNLFAGGGSVWRCPISYLLNPPQPASDTQAVPLISSGGINDTLSGDSATSRAHRIDFVNHTNASLTITNADLTILNNHFSMSQIFPGLPDTVMPGDTFSMIVNFTGNDSGTVYLDTIVLTIDPDELVSSYYVYLKGNSFGTAPAGGVSQSSPGATADLRIYPNPFSQSTQIAFTSASGYAEVSVMNLLGVEVARIFYGELDGGVHSFTWDALGAAAGTYFCIVRMNGGVERVPMALAR